MCRRNVLLLAVACLVVGTHHVYASVIIKTVPRANVKMEFGAHHVPPHDVALLEESAKVDGTTRLGIEVPHSHNHRNVLIHKIGTYLTVVMKALAKTVAPSQDQDGKTHFDIHVDADLGENDSNDKNDETPQFTIVQSKHGELAEEINGDCVKAVVIVSESEGDKEEEHKSSDKHNKDEHKKKDSHMVLRYSSEDANDSKEQHKKKESHVVFHYNSEDAKDSKEEHKKKDSHVVFHYNSEDAKDSKEEHKKKDSRIVFHYSTKDSKESKEQGHHKETIHEDLEEKMQLSSEKKEEKKDAENEHFIIEAPKDWESFKKTQEMLKEKGIVLQLEKSFFISKEHQQKPSQKAQSLDVKNKIKLSLQGKSLSEEDMEESERNSKSLELTDADPEGVWITMMNQTDTNTEFQSHLVKNEIHSESPSYSTVHTTPANEISKGGTQIQTVKTTYQSGPAVVTTTKSVSDVPSNGNKAVGYEMVKQTFTPEKLSPTKPQLSFSANEIPSHVSSHFQQTSYSSDRSRSMTIVSNDPTVDPSKGAMSQPVVFQVKDKLKETSETSKTVPYVKIHDDSSREVIMRLAPGSKTSPTKKSQIIDVKKIKVSKADKVDEVEPDETAKRQEGIRKLPMANIPTLIDVLQKSPPPEVQRLTQLVGGGTSHESQKEHSSAEDKPTIPTINITDPLPSKPPREFQLPEVQVSEPNSEERKGQARSIEDFESSIPTDYKEMSKTARSEKLHTYPETVHSPNEGGVAEAPSGEHPGGDSKGLEVNNTSNLEDNPIAEELGGLKHISENPRDLKSLEVSIDKGPNKQQKERMIDSLNDEIVQKNAKDNIGHEGEREEKSFHGDSKNLEEEKASDTSAAVEDIDNDPRASQAVSLCSLTASAEEARALDLSSPQTENQPVTNDSPVEEVAASPRNLNQDGESPLQEADVPDTAEGVSEVSQLGRNTTSPSQEEITGYEPPLIEDKAAGDSEPKESTPSDVHNVLSAYDDSSVISPVTEPSTTPSLPEKESMSVPVHKERELSLEDNANAPASNLVELTEEAQVDEVDRDGRIYDSRPGSSSLPATILETSVSSPGTPLSNAIHDPNIPFIYSYYPALHPIGTYSAQNNTDDAQGLYGRPSPKVICVNTDTGKVLGDSSKIEDQSNVVTKYSADVNKSNKEDDKLMLLKLLHEDIQKLKQQLKIQ